MPGVTPVQRRDSSGQMGQMFQMGKTAFDAYNGSGKPDAGAPAGNIASAPPPAVPTQPPPAADQGPQNNAGAIDRRIAASGYDPNKFRGGY